MSSRLRKLPLALPAVLAVLALSACGNSTTKVTTGTYAGEGGVGAPYLNVGPLIYEVQISRELNPANPEDATYLQGLGPSELKLEAGEEWFALFLQVYNHTSREEPAASSVTVYDTQGNTYSPIVPNAANLFAYRAGPVPAKSQIPLPGTVPDDFGPQGEMLLYKLQVASLENRPIKVKIVNPEDPAEAATAELDV